MAIPHESKMVSQEFWAGDIPPPIVDLLLEGADSPEAQNRRREQWGSLSPGLRDLMAAEIFRLSPADPELRGKISSAFLDIFAGIEGTGVSKSLDEEFAEELTELRSLMEEQGLVAATMDTEINIGPIPDDNLLPKRRSHRFTRSIVIGSAATFYAKTLFRSRVKKPGNSLDYA